MKKRTQQKVRNMQIDSLFKRSQLNSFWCSESYRNVTIHIKTLILPLARCSHTAESLNTKWDDIGRTMHNKNQRRS